jgi:rhodanese-related sulfurtransferase
MTRLMPGQRSPQLRRLRAILASIGGWKTMDKRWIATVTLILSPLCSCESSRGPELQAAKREASIPANGVSEQIKEISTSQLKEWMTTGQTFTLIDVREDNEWQGGHAASAMHISRWTLSGNIGTVAPDKTARIVLYCLGGVRSAASAVTLQRMGYSNVFSLAGGFRNYQLAGLPIQK